MSRGKRVFMIGLLAVATVPVVYVITRPSTGEPLTPEGLAEARARWKERGPKSYVLDVDVRGARHHIEARDGVVVTMTTDGNPVRADAREYWSVDGMFRFLSEEIANLQRVEAAYGVSDPDDVVLRAAFDAQYGYPARFLRHVLGQDRSVEWQVVSFLELKNP
jgi:hypothetical protein